MSGQCGKSWLLGVTALALTAICLSGCGLGEAREHPLQRQVEELQQKNADLTAALEDSQAEATRLEEQIEGLLALPEGRREDNPYRLERINVTRYTNFYDKDEDGHKEKLIVYLEPIDPEGDAVKTAGTVHVQLWNLNKPSDEALLGQWQVQPDELRELWFDTLVAANYRLTFDAPAGTTTTAQPLTVKATFTDYLTGKIFRDQYVIEPAAGAQ
jgi:hypothetical protein